MQRRVRSAVILGASVALLVLPPQTAGGWSNGRWGPNSYGTHDWILDKPLKQLQRSGSVADWVKRKVALKATDNPDTVNGIEFGSSPWWHVYDVWGSKYGGAPEAIKHWYDLAARRLANGNRAKASKALGILAHLVGDLANPMHTDSKPLEDPLHSPYESDVDERVSKSSSEFRFFHDGRHASAPYAKAVSLATKSHRWYDHLLRNYDQHGFNKAVRRVTQKQLNRGANALSDLIAGIKARAAQLKQPPGTGGGGGGGGNGGGCDPSYPDFCIPPPPPDRDCDDVDGTNFTVKGNDPHAFDSDGDGVGCES